MVKDKIRAGHWELKNRMVKAPIHSETCVNGRITEETLKHYKNRTEDGRFGLVVVEHCFVRKDGMASATQLGVENDEAIEGLKRICDIIHKNGSTAILQISHAGCGALRSVTGCQPVSASNISVNCGWPGGKPNPENPEAFTLAEKLAKKTDYEDDALRVEYLELLETAEDIYGSGYSYDDDDYDDDYEYDDVDDVNYIEAD